LSEAVVEKREIKSFLKKGDKIFKELESWSCGVINAGDVVAPNPSCHMLWSWHIH
jgi:hypothetical protein